MRWLALLAATAGVAGCGEIYGVDAVDASHAPHDAPSGDAISGGDAGSDAGPGSAIDATVGSGSGCVGTVRSFCPAPPPMADLVLQDPIDTTTEPSCIVESQVGGPPLCVLFGANVTVNNTVTVTGDRALVLVAMGTLTVAGTLDVSSHTKGSGPAANTAACGTPAAGSDDTLGGGGGAGGSYHGLGGSGGGFDGKGTTTTAAATPAFIASILRGGCAGEAGGRTPSAQASAPGGDSGGAVWLVAGTEVEIDGSVWAGGAGGSGAVSNGGGGGGAGGFIGIDAPMVHLMSHSAVTANGGGGGGGASLSVPGSPGADAGSVGQLAGASGGNGAPPGGGNGGAGSFAQLSGAAGGNSGDSSGGGGGGAAGYVIIYGGVTAKLDTGAVISPQPGS